MRVASCGPRGVIIFVMIIAILLAVSGPTQPETGPGGKDYPHRSYTVRKFGEDEKAFWIFLPSEPRPDTAPVILFLHGWLEVDPVGFIAWLEHLARRGNVVIYPRYQRNPLHPRPNMFAEATEAFKKALGIVPSLGVVPDTSRFAVVGHSIGGMMAFAIASSWDSLGLPRPKAVMSVQGGGKPIPAFAPEKIHENTLLIAVAGDDDFIVGEGLSREMITRAVQVPDSNKDFLVVMSDDHGFPPLFADHISALAGRPGMGCCAVSLITRFYGKSGANVDALDWYGWWKLFDGLCDAAFYGKNRKYALGGAPEQLYMGTWSDGFPVKRIKRPLFEGPEPE